MTESNLQTQSSSALAVMQDQNPIDIQIQTAHKFPRDLFKFMKMAETFATVSVMTAESCWYTVPRAGRNISGPSIRLAEICANAWGNLRFGSRLVHEAEDHVICEGFAHDLESNTAMRVEVRRSIVNKKGDRFSPDMIGNTINAGCAIALRNSVFKIVPRAFVDAILEKAKAVAVGTQQTLDERRLKMISHFKKMGVSEQQVLEKVNVSNIQSITLEHIEELIGISNSIKENMVNIEDAFPPSESEMMPKKKSEAKIEPKKDVAPVDFSKADDLPPFHVEQSGKVNDVLGF